MKKSSTICSINECDNKPIARGWCNKHYCRWRSYGDPEYPVNESKAARVVDLPNGDRVCGTCQEPKPLTEYHKDTRGPKGYRGICKPCRGGYMHTYYRENREQKLEYEVNRRLNDLERIRGLDNARYQRDKAKRIELATQHAQVRRARILGREVDQGITVLRLRKLYGDACPYCTQTMTFTPGKRGDYNPLRASIEHLMPISKGGTHTWDNCILACLGCNLSRGNGAQPTHVQQALNIE